ncbi:uncharacterized protein LOC126898605 [Daktulosphaira vitifoliae]|uniref:uncharacterized protein LOC126898605 n=1 Tax=Daktulosphaira vitifoliae TaxID=58002 RepID=UPI0021AA3CCB|nr:uncharacterized protein LOC126898605 [Daktulosphaira vitifoliae]
MSLNDDDSFHNVDTYIIPMEKMIPFYEKLKTFQNRQRQLTKKTNESFPSFIFRHNFHNKKKKIPPNNLPVSTPKKSSSILFTSTTTSSLDKDNFVNTHIKNNKSIGVKIIGHYSYDHTGKPFNHLTSTMKTEQRTVSISTSGVDRYLKMGWYSARCLLLQYQRKDLTESELKVIRQRLKDLIQFWIKVVGLSIVFMWATFGCFHDLFCCGASLPENYSKEVNRYLIMVPPNVVVTSKGKLYNYQPTTEERFLWSSAKKLATLRL